MTNESNVGIRSAAIVGAGRMGGGIAECLVCAGLEVAITDATPHRSEIAYDRLVARIRAHLRSGLITTDIAALVRRLRVARDVAEAVDGADLVIEAVTEDIVVKEGTLRSISAAAPHNAVVASNTSSFDVDALAQFVVHPHRFLVTHWFNPPEWIPGVEVVVGKQTDRSVAERVAVALRAAGKKPSVIATGIGFVANRLQMALFCEAVRCVEEGLASPNAIDEVVRTSFGFRLPFFGPFKIADMAGLDVYEAVLQEHARGLGDRFAVPAALRDLVARGRLGTTAGAGFYDYEAGSGESLLIERDRCYAALDELLRRVQPSGPDATH